MPHWCFGSTTFHMGRARRRHGPHPAGVTFRGLAAWDHYTPGAPASDSRAGRRRQHTSCLGAHGLAVGASFTLPTRRQGTAVLAVGVGARRLRLAAPGASRVSTSSSVSALHPQLFGRLLVSTGRGRVCGCSSCTPLLRGPACGSPVAATSMACHQHPPHVDFVL